MSTPAPALFYFGANHHRTPIELREKLALTELRWAEFRPRVQGQTGLREYALLNTCNRVEFYGVAEAPEIAHRLARDFAEFQGFTHAEFSSIRQDAFGPESLQHLIAVASGIDSQMLGETEILGQVKEAYAKAQAAQSVGPVLNRVFQKTFQYAKYVRSNTAITEGQISVANVAVDLAQKIFGQLDSVRVLLLGAGEIGEKTAKAFRSRGSAAPTISSRTLGRAMELAQLYGGVAIPFDHFPQYLHEYDIVVCSTAAPSSVVSAAHVSTAMNRRRAQPLFFIDLALPRDVDPAVAQLTNVFVYNLDDLARIAEENLSAREAEVKRARVLIEEKAAALWQQVTPYLERKES